MHQRCGHTHNSRPKVICNRFGSRSDTRCVHRLSLGSLINGLLPASSTRESSLYVRVIERLSCSCGLQAPVIAFGCIPRCNDVVIELRGTWIARRIELLLGVNQGCRVFGAERVCGLCLRLIGHIGKLCGMKQKLKKALREMALIGLAVAVALFVYNGILTIETYFAALVDVLALSPIPWSAYRLGRFVFTR